MKSAKLFGKTGWTPERIVEALYRPMQRGQTVGPVGDSRLIRSPGTGALQTGQAMGKVVVDSP